MANEANPLDFIRICGSTDNRTPGFWQTLRAKNPKSIQSGQELFLYPGKILEPNKLLFTKSMNTAIPQTRLTDFFPPTFTHDRATKSHADKNQALLPPGKNGDISGTQYLDPYSSSSSILVTRIAEFGRRRRKIEEATKSGEQLLVTPQVYVGPDARSYISDYLKKLTPDQRCAETDSLTEITPMALFFPDNTFCIQSESNAFIKIDQSTMHVNEGESDLRLISINGLDPFEDVDETGMQPDQCDPDEEEIAYPDSLDFVFLQLRAMGNRILFFTTGISLNNAPFSEFNEELKKAIKNPEHAQEQVAKMIELKMSVTAGKELVQE